MPLSDVQRDQIAGLLKEQLRRKLNEYSPETSNMPFHVRLLGKDKMALFSFIQSVNTMLGTSVFEQIAVIIAFPHFKRVVNQYKELGNEISLDAIMTIRQIIDDLRTARARPDKPSELTKISQVARSGISKTTKRPRLDLFLQSEDGTEYYLDIKTAKPNIEGIIALKQKLLEWVAIRERMEPRPRKIYTGLAIPYNPYEPEPYARWTFQGMFDLANEIMVADEFWNFLGGKHTYEDLLQVFEQVGLELRPEIDARFSSLA